VGFACIRQSDRSGVRNWFSAYTESIPCSELGGGKVNAWDIAQSCGALDKEKRGVTPLRIVRSAGQCRCVGLVADASSFSLSRSGKAAYLRLSEGAMSAVLLIKQPNLRGLVS
jgi:hypothetical protein